MTISGSADAVLVRVVDERPAARRRVSTGSEKNVATQSPGVAAFVGVARPRALPSLAKLTNNSARAFSMNAMTSFTSAFAVASPRARTSAPLAVALRSALGDVARARVSARTALDAINAIAIVSAAIARVARVARIIVLAVRPSQSVARHGDTNRHRRSRPCLDAIAPRGRARASIHARENVHTNVRKTIVKETS